MFSDILKQELYKSGINQRIFAEEIGVSEATVSRYVNGSREPKLHTLKKMAMVLHVSADYLLGIEVK